MTLSPSTVYVSVFSALTEPTVKPSCVAAPIVPLYLVGTSGTSGVSGVVNSISAAFKTLRVSTL